MPKIALIYATNPSKKEAEKLASHLLKKKLIACANIFPIKSLYWWEGKIEKSEEFVLLAKTLDKNFEKAKKEIEKSILTKSHVSSNFLQNHLNSIINGF